MTEDLNRSLLMAAYNYARHFAIKTSIFDVNRVDRAWGYIMSGKLAEKVDEYGTTLKSCDCMDRAIRRCYCKHSIGLMIVVKARQLAEA